MRATVEQAARNLDPQTLDLYVGTYEFPEASGLTLSVTRAENKLYASQSRIGTAGAVAPVYNVLLCAPRVRFLPIQLLT